MATNPPSHPCMICGGKLEWRNVTRPRPPGEPVRFGPTDWEQMPHECPPGAAAKFYEDAIQRGAEKKAKPFFTTIEPNREKAGDAGTSVSRVTKNGDTLPPLGDSSGTATAKPQ